MNKLILISLFTAITLFTFNRANASYDKEFNNLENQKYNSSEPGNKSNAKRLNTFSIMAAPLNDDICNAEPLTVGGAPVTGSVSMATLETSETGGSCWLSPANNTVWYSFVAPGSGLIEITTDFVTGLSDTQMTLYAVIDCSNFLSSTEIGCSENNGFTGSGNMAVISTSLFPLIAGQTYHVQIDGFGTSVGDFKIQVKELPPLNDDCASAKLLAANGNGSLVNQFFGAATDSGGGAEICDYDSTVDPGDIWYEIQIVDSIATLVVVVEPGINSDIVVAVYDSCVSVFPEACVDLGGIGGTENINLSVFSSKYFLRIYEKETTGEPLEIGVQGEILPIVLDRFNAKAKKRGNSVTWSTLSEINSDYVEVQSSPNGSTKWEKIGEVATKGESNSRLDYELFDYNPYKVTYYRLKAVDKDGKSEFSRMINVRRSDDLGKMTLSPNPANAAISVQTTSNTKEIGTIRVVDMTGKLMMERTVNLIEGLNTINIELYDLQAGLYLFSFQTEDGMQVEKFVKQ